MEAVLKRLQTLSSDQLREQITAAGLKGGPITATTRSVFEKRLARALLENQTDGSDSVNQNDSNSSMEELHPPINQQNIQEMNHETQTTKNPEISSDTPSVYYGVCPHPDHSSGEDDAVHVYVNKTEALKAVLRLKGARFKAFSSREMAENFSKGLCEERGVSPHKPSPEKASAASLTESSVKVDVEKANEFKSPRTQDLTAKLRRAVETGDKESFTNLVWDNPRYLIGSGDNPTIVQEGCRYNVLHVAAKENQAEMSCLILETLQNLKFMRLMYPHDEDVVLYQRIRYITDLYLNTPDKANNETPLHFACKFGCPDVVNVLCSHPNTDKNCRNKYGQKPLSVRICFSVFICDVRSFTDDDDVFVLMLKVICERKNKSKEVKQKIREYLEDRFYVPLLRATDNTLHPVIGSPWCPGSSESVDEFYEPMMMDGPKNPVMTIKAFVGPLNLLKAEEFHRLWKTPPRDRARYFHHILKSDWDQGAERVGRELAHELGFPWAEYWQFLNCFIDLSTEDGLKMLEEYLSGCETFTAKQRRSDGTSGSVCKNGSFGTGCEDDDAAGNGQRFLVCDLMQEFEKVSVQNTLLSHEHTDDPADEDSESWNNCRRRQTEDDELSCSSEDYFTAEEDVGNLERFLSSDGQCSASVMSTSSSSRRRMETDSCSSSGSSFKSSQSTSDLLPHTPDIFILGNSPTKLDNEVLQALNDVDIDSYSYPNIIRWKNKVLSYPSSQRQSWPAVSRVSRVQWSADSAGSLSCPRSAAPVGSCLALRAIHMISANKQQDV